MMKEVVAQGDHAALFKITVPLSDTGLPLLYDVATGGGNSPKLTDTVTPNNSSPVWSLDSCATFLRAQSNLLGQNSESELSCFLLQYKTTSEKE